MTDASAERPTAEQPPLPGVLVVDDAEASLVALSALLGDMKCTVSLARSGNDALRQLLERDFAVMLLDVQMPDMDGYEVARHARQNPGTRNVPIIFVTASPDTEDTLLRGYGTGAVDFLFKPINGEVLRSKVRVFLDLHAGSQRLKRANAELEQAYRDLRTTQSQLIQSAKMASLGELVAGVAHEINNPLAFALSHLDTVERSLLRCKSEIGTALPGAAQEQWDRATNRLEEMRIGLERIRHLVLKLRTFSRLDEGERTLISVKDGIDSILTILGHRFGDRIQVDVTIGEPDMIECSPGLFNEALANLVSNAIDAIDGKGTITIQAGRSGDSYSISVSDTGRGIPESLRERVLDPFFTTKPIGEGTGLGLSISYGIVRKHGGVLEIGAAEGGGARVAISIPLAPAENEGSS